MEQKEQSSKFDWGKYLTEQKSEAAPVHLFPHAQMSRNWYEINNGVKVEAVNHDCRVSCKAYWIAQVIKVAGYKALLRYEGFGEDDSKDFWCNVCTDDVHPVGWCATVGKPLLPPKTIQFKHNNWKHILVQKLTGSKTLPNDFQERVLQSLHCPFSVNMRVEVVDKTQISRKRIGIVEQVMGGRLRLRYEDSEDTYDEFWCHAGSPLISYIGWSEKVGHRILAMTKDSKNKPGYKNSKPELFATVKQVKTCGFREGMKLEAIDPLNLSCICVATVRQVLKNGYLMIGIDGSEAAGGTDWFCYHCTSPTIFPVGFCEENNISLNAPKCKKEPFTWEGYLIETGSEAAPPELFLRVEIDHGFSTGMKLEAVDLMEPRLLCVATVTRVVGRLLRVHFDGWDDEYDQWIDSQSSDIYPVGWCELVGYALQPPANMRLQSNAGASDKSKKRTKSKPFTSSGKRKRKRISLTGKKVSQNGQDDDSMTDEIVKETTDTTSFVDIENISNDQIKHESNGESGKTALMNVIPDAASEDTNHISVTAKVQDSYVPVESNANQTAYPTTDIPTEILPLCNETTSEVVEENL